MTRDLSALFPHPLPCITIERWTSTTGWPEFRIIHTSDEGQKTLFLADTLAAALAAAKAYARTKGIPFVDLGPDYA